MTAFYNEIDPYAAQWLRNLIEAGHIAPGVVDERSITELTADDVRGYTQVHFFAGIGVWSHALRLAGWSDDRPVWTGSCPCQPFSTAGKRKGIDDDRHLWPHFFRLISQCRPPVVLGEQVASKDGLAWLDAVSADLEGADYAFGAADLCAAGVGAPHIRQRLWFVGVAGGLGHCRSAGAGRDARADDRSEAGSDRERQQPRPVGDRPELASDAGRLGDACGERLAGWARVRERAPISPTWQTSMDGQGIVKGYWDPADWVLCRDPGGPRWRPVEPGTFPLVDGAPSRVGRLRAYGNAIVAPLAATWIEAVIESIE